MNERRVEKSVSAQSTTGSVTIMDMLSVGNSFGFVQSSPTAELVWEASTPAFGPVKLL